MTPGTSIASDTFRANGIQDPRFATGGHSPLMFDEYAALYGHYRVISSTASMVPLKTTTTSQVPGLYGIYLDSDSTQAYASADVILEDMRLKQSVKQTGFGNSVDYNKLPVARSSFNAKKFLSPEGYSNAVPVTTDPDALGSIAFYQCWTASPDGIASTALATYMLTITYVVEFTDPLEIAQS